MSNYFDHLNSVVSSPKNPYMQDCGELPVQMCRVDGGKLWRFLMNEGYTDDAADTIMRDYFKINTYGKSVESIVAENPDVVAECIAKGTVDNIIPYIKKLIGSECYNGSIAHLLQLIREAPAVVARPVEELARVPSICMKMYEIGATYDNLYARLKEKFGETTTLTDEEALDILCKEGT